MIKLLFACLAVAMVVHTFALQTRAQFMDSMGTGWNNAMSASASTMVWNSIFYKTTGASKGSTRTPTAATNTSQAVPRTTSQPAQPVKAANPNAVKFRPTGAYVKTRDLANSLTNSPVEREQYQKLMNAALDAYCHQAQKLGFPNDIAAALAYFLGENIRIYRGAAEMSDQQYITLRNTIADAVISSGAVSNLTDRQKQEMYETLVAYTGITQYGYEEALKAGNQEITAGYQKVAGQSLQTVTKLSPDSMNFTENGLTVN